MKKALIFALLLSSFSSMALEYGPFNKFFQLGKVEFFRSTGYFEGREADYEVTVLNNYWFPICLIPELVAIKNGRDEYDQNAYIIPAGTQVNLGNYGALLLGKSWHMKWEYFVSQDLSHCEG